MKIYVISDTHGYPFSKIKTMLEKVGFCSDDWLYVLGDTVDRGHGEDMRLFIRYILAQPNVRLILGNHEKMVLNNACLLEEPRKSRSELTVREDQSYRLWMANGGEPTWEMFQKLSTSETDRILKLFREAPLYEEVFIGTKRFILCHSGLGSYSPDKSLKEYTERDLLWYRPELNERFWLGENTMTVFGHTPNIYMDGNNSGIPIVTSTFINIDTGAALGESYTPCLFCLNFLLKSEPQRFRTSTGSFIFVRFYAAILTALMEFLFGHKNQNRIKTKSKNVK